MCNKQFVTLKDVMVDFRAEMINEVVVDYDCFYSDRLCGVDGPMLTDLERYRAITKVLPHEY